MYYDAIVSDNRWTLETVKDGVRNGGLAINHAAVAGLVKEGDRVVGVTYHDQLGRTTYEARARAVINATGVFADQIRRFDRPSASNLLKLSKGTHLVFGEGDVPFTVSIVFFSPVDGRPLLLVKREGCFLFDTTDDWEDVEDYGAIHITFEDGSVAQLTSTDTVMGGIYNYLQVWGSRTVVRANINPNNACIASRWPSVTTFTQKAP